MKWKTWIRGLASAAIGAAAGAVPAVIVAPETFNVQEGLPKLALVCAVSALLAVANYLKSSPLPPGNGDAGACRFWAVPAILAVALLWVQLSGCAGTPESGAEATVYRGLKASAGAYEFAMPLVADLYQRGILEQPTWEKACKLGTAYAVAYHAAVEASLVWKKTHGEAELALLNKALAASAEALVVFMTYVRPVLERYGINL